MKATFLGGATKVGSLAMVMQVDGMRLLFEYGMTPSKPPEYPLPLAEPVDALFLIHAHLDHSGMLPYAVAEYQIPYTATPLTNDLIQILLEDSLKVSRYEGYPQKYTIGDMKLMKEYYTPVREGESLILNDVEIKALSAGHIPGSLMYLVDGERSVLFTGDINTIDTNLVSGTRAPRCDTLIIESTYAGREHELREKTIYRFLGKVEEVVDRGGVAIVPAFGLGRTQELLLILQKSGYRIWVDGMGKRISSVLLKNPSEVKNTRRLRKALADAHLIRNPKQRKKALKGDVIITTSGMLDGGPVIEYIIKLKDNPKNAILLTGYQVENTNGRRLLEKGTMELAGVEEKINIDVEFFDFSAHAGHSQLVDFIRESKAEKVLLMHGDNREELKEAVDDGSREVILPEEGKSVEL